MSRESLDLQERELADALARLPAIEPPSALDARVLAQAREALRPAVATRPRRRRRPWWMGAGMGTAAAAVLAAGVAWQAGLFDMSFGSDVPVPRMPGRSASSDADAPIAVDLGRAPAAAPAAPPPPAEPALAPPTPPAPPPPAAAARQQGVQQAMGEPAPEPSRALARERTEAAHKAAAPAMAEPQHRAPAPATADTALESITVTGTRVVPDTSRILPPWREDAQLAPDEWLERIRERVRRGDRTAAALSLHRFTLAHPSRPVPDDLVLLLAGRP